MFGPIASFLLFVPFIFIIWMANLADGRRTRGRPSPGLAAITYIMLVGTYGALALIGVLVGVLASVPADSSVAGLRPAQSEIASHSLFTLGLIVPSVIGMILLLRPVRQAFAFIIPVEPRSTTHSVALSYSMLLFINLLATLGMGIENIAASLGNSSPSAPDPSVLAGIWTQEMAWVLLGMVGVGLLARRGPLAVLQRLGIVPPSPGQCAIGIVVGAALAGIALGILAAWSALGLPLDQGVQKLSERLLGPVARTLPGILTLGIAAALGEETLFRGALQPRFGLVLTSLLFALAHSTYGLSLYTGIVLLVGLVLGLLRQRFNTSTSMMAHASYNIAQALLDLLTSGT